jgi:CP family cyanate transporter-like MFS transporter
MLAMMGGATVAAAVSVPLADAVSSWPRSLAAWSGLALVGLLAWTPVVRRVNAHEDPDVDPAPAGGLPWRSAAAWTISAYLALQSTQFYSQLAWVAPYFTDRGSSAREAGVLLAVFAGAQIVSGIGGPALADRLRDRRPLVGAAVVANAVGLAGMLSAPAAGPVWMTLTGLGQGAGFALALVYLADWAGTPAAAARLSAMGFLVGYSVASLGPIGFGALRDASGGFTAPLAALLVLAVVQLGVVVLMRPGRRGA